MCGEHSALAGAPRSTRACNDMLTCGGVGEYPCAARPAGLVTMTPLLDPAVQGITLAVELS